MLAYLVVLIRLCDAETAIEHDELGGAVGILDGCDTAEVRPPAHLRDEIGTRGCDSHRALPSSPLKRHPERAPVRQLLNAFRAGR